jgi:type I restriction enzyme S subunit
LKRVLTLNDSGTWGDDPIEGNATPVVRSTDILLDGSWALDDVALRMLSPDERREKRLRAGDLVVVKSSGSAAHLGKTAIATEEVASLGACFANFVQRLRPGPDADPRYVWYLLNSHQASAELAILGNTTTGLRNLNGGTIGSVTFPGPPLTEQRAIADFLDTETARIDGLIAKKRRLIELLIERQRTLTSERIFGQHGIKWTTLRHLVDLLPGFAFKSEDFRPESGRTVRLLRGVNVAPGKLRWEDVVYIDASARAEYGTYELRPDDIVIGMDRPVVGSGMRVAQVQARDLPTLLVQRVARIRPNRHADASYVRLALQSDAFVDYFTPITTGISVPHISPEQILAFRVPAPPKARQAMISKELMGAEEGVARVRHSLGAQIELLADHRQAMITAAVTGELDVSGRIAAEAS